MSTASIYDFETIIAERERIKKEEEGAKNGVDVSDKGTSAPPVQHDYYGSPIITSTDSLLHYPTGCADDCTHPSHNHVPWAAPGSYYTDYALDDEDEIILGIPTVTNIIESPIPNRVLP